MPLIVTAAVPAGLVLAPAATAQEPPDPCLLIFEAAEATIVGRTATTGSSVPRALT
jgi:hypothetical protein